MPVFDNSWRQGSFKIYLNYNLNKSNEDQIQLIITNLKKIDKIFE